MSWSATSSRTAGARPSACSRRSKACRCRRSAIAAWCARNSTSTPRCSVAPGSCWSTNWRTRTWSTASRRRGMPSAGRTSRSCCDAGIDVWTTLNVQHLESLNDLVAQITGVRQRETIPDHVLDEADEIELIDLPPDDLLQRLQQGKVYVPDQVGTAVERFFRKPNLIALRELALRRTADRVDAAARAQGLRGIAIARLAGARPAAGRHRSRRAGRAARAHRQAARRRARRRVDGGLRGDARAAAPVGGGARPAHRRPAPGGIAGRRDRDAGRPDGRHGADRIRAHARRDTRAGRRAEAARLARAVAALDGDGTRAARAGLRRAGGRAAGRGGDRGGPSPTWTCRAKCPGRATAGRRRSRRSARASPS